MTKHGKEVKAINFKVNEDGLSFFYILAKVLWLGIKLGRMLTILEGQTKIIKRKKGEAK